MSEGRNGMQPFPHVFDFGNVMVADGYLVMTNILPKAWLAGIFRTPQTIGRGRDAEIRIPGGFLQVSRQHAQIWCDEVGFWLRDCNSTFGTRVNEVPVPAGREVQVVFGDKLWLGSVKLQVLSESYLTQRFPSPRHLNCNYVEEEATDFHLEAANEVSPRSALGFDALTPSEFEVVLWMSRGYMELHEIGKCMVRSPHTIRSHLQNIFLKLGVHSREQLLARFLRRFNTSPKAKG